MLANYEFLTLALLQAPSSPIPVVATSSIQSYINKAREQVALLGECVRSRGRIVVPTASFAFDFDMVVPVDPAYGTLATARQMWVDPTGPLVDVRPYEWYVNYTQRKPLPAGGVTAAVFRQGSTGAVFLVTGLQVPLTLLIDGIWNPTPLLDDTTEELIPQPFQAAVPFYAAWLAFMSLQRQMDADKMMARFTERMNWARAEVTPSVLPEYTLGGPGTKMAAGHGSLAAPAPPPRGQ